MPPPNRIPPLFPYYGSKYHLAPLYDPPRHGLIVEPFAGSAQYALLHYTREVLLVDACPRVATVWAYLLSATPSDILELPIMSEDAEIDSVQWPCVGAKALARSHLASGDGIVGQHNRRSPRMIERFRLGHANAWTRATLQRIAAAVPLIRHWRFIHGDYTAAPDTAATWFVDPPYERRGQHYKQSSRRLDFAALGEWCRRRVGQVIVCENADATWIRTEPVRVIKGVHNTWNTESVWYGGGRSQSKLFMEAP